MTKMMLRRRQREHGATGIEYGLIAALVAAVLIAIVSITGVNLSTVYCTVAGEVGTATGVDGPCNTGGGGNDTPDPDDPYVCENGSYSGDYTDPRFYWIKVDEHQNGGFWYENGNPVYYAFNGGDPDPATSGDFVKSYWEIQPITTYGAESMAPPSDGLERYFWPADPCTGDFRDPNDGGGDGGNSDPNCDGNSYIGTTDDWYWVKTESYENGTLTTTAQGTTWEGNDWGEKYTWEERGAMVDNPLAFAERWGANVAGNIYGNTIRYANGGLGVAVVTSSATDPRLSVDAYDMARLEADTPSDYTEFSNTGWYGDYKRFDEDNKGALIYTNWSGSPDNTDGVHYSTSPAQPGDDVTYGYSCGEIIG